TCALPIYGEAGEGGQAVAVLRLRQGGQRGDGGLRLGPRPLLGVAQAAGALDRELDRRQVLCAACLDRLADHVPLGRAAVRHRIDQRQRRLPFRELVADVLAELLGRRGVIERVVEPLERLAEVAAVARERLPRPRVV